MLCPGTLTRADGEAAGEAGRTGGVAVLVFIPGARQHGTTRTEQQAVIKKV